MRRRLAGLALLAVSAAACLLPPPPATAPIPVRRLGGSGSDPCLLVLLPGRGDGPEDFSKAEFAGAVAAAGVAAEVVAVDAHLGYYRDKSILERLAADVVGPARARGRTVWLAGISLGGLGSLLYGFERPGEVAGLLLLAPYLGEAEVVDEVAAAGGARAWTPGRASAGVELGPRLWGRLRGWAEGRDRLPPAVLLGYAEGDRFAPGHRLLADLLPPERVRTVAGGHTWRAWRALWAELLADPALAASCR